MVVLPELCLGLDPQLQPLGLRPPPAELSSQPLPVDLLTAGSSGAGFACLQGSPGSSGPPYFRAADLPALQDNSA
jgi:hypothetical protein